MRELPRQRVRFRVFMIGYLNTDLCPNGGASSPRLTSFSLQSSCFLKSVITVGFNFFTELDPISFAADGPRFTQAIHSCEQIRTTLVKLFIPGLGRSRTVMCR